MEKTFQSTTKLGEGIPEGSPFLSEVTLLFDYVSNRAFEPLADLCDDDFGIVDLDPTGGNVMVRTRAEWENWFQSLFQQLETMQAQTWTTITNYQVRTSSEMAMSVVEFTQHLAHNGVVLDFGCVATIVWKATPDGWKELRWHVSLIEPPAGMPQ